MIAAVKTTGYICSESLIIYVLYGDVSKLAVYPDGSLISDKANKHIVRICRAGGEIIDKILLPHPFAGYIIRNDFDCAAQSNTIAIK